MAVFNLVRYVCDRCGNDVSAAEDAADTRPRDMYQLRLLYKRGGIAIPEVDICEKCQEKFIDWLQSGGKLK